MKFKIITFLLVLVSFAQAKRDDRDEDALKTRIQKDELYHHAKAQGLQILGPDPEGDESVDLELKDDNSDTDTDADVDQGQVDFKQKRDAQSELNDYEGGDESANNSYNRRFRTAQMDDGLPKASKFQTMNSAYYKLMIRLRNVERRVVRLEKAFREISIVPSSRMGFRKSPAVDK